MRRIVWRCLMAVWLFGMATSVMAEQKFFNLISEEVKIDSVLPNFVYTQPLPDNYQDSVYTVRLKYAEYVDMTQADILKYNHISGAALPKQVPLSQSIAVCRRKGMLMVSFSPLVYRNNKYQILVSFMLDIQAKAAKSVRKMNGVVASTRADDSNSIYAAHSVLSSGRWAKIRVGETGVYQLTDALIRRAGFSDLSKVKIYGYGGNLQREALYASDLRQYDDLSEVPQCIVDGKHFFYAKGSVSWENNRSARRTRNPYSDYGYYFITESDTEPATVDSEAFLASFYPSTNDYHSLYEVDAYSWYHGGRNLFDSRALSTGDQQEVVVTNTTGDASGILSVNISADIKGTTGQVLLNGKPLGTIVVDVQTYCTAGEKSGTFSVSNLKTDGGKDTIAVKNLSGGGTIRLDYISMAWNKPVPAPELTGNLPTPEYVYNVSNQDHHADGVADMVIIVPTSGKLLKQAQRLKDFHESHDGLRVSIVPADELYNEFSSGTPDVNAYRRYLRMLQDKAATEADMPKYLLLFGDCLWDNRLLTSDCQRLNADDYLLCHESENSFSKVYCYVSDSWIGMLAEGAGSAPERQLQDVAVGRFPVSTAAEAKILVDKTISYAQNANAGTWQNTLVFMGDDGNANLHMRDANSVADNMISKFPDYTVKKVMWDAYTRETSSTGNSYPEITKLLKQQQENGALVMDYAGHGSETQLSHEKVVKLSDFEGFRNRNLPLWVTAACDIMPFDGVGATLGEAALLNEKGGAVAFYGTTRTVYATQNRLMNWAFMERVLKVEDGKPITIGEAHRRAQNVMVTGQAYDHYDGKGNPSIETDQSVNHLQYSLLGDPALALNLPRYKIVVDSINGVLLQEAETKPVMKAGSVVRIAGHVENATSFHGVVTATVRDSEEKIVCKNNVTGEERPDTAFTYRDRPKTLYIGSDSVRAGKFAFTFAVPKDINYSNESGMMTLYAVNDDKTLLANGHSDDFLVGETEEHPNDSIGPSIYCYLNSPSFVDGGNVNPTPFFVAEISDKDGINAAGSGIGHDLQLVIDGDMTKTYTLNDNFVYDFGTYTSGTTYYSIPELSAGQHTLQFRAWDIQNNSSVSTLRFNVVKGLEPNLFSVSVTNNPARTSTTFIINHDRMESDMDVVIELFDTSGRLLWTHAERDVPTSSSYTVQWDLTRDGGRPLRTGVYLYRVKIAADGSSYASKAQKLIILNDK